MKTKNATLSLIIRWLPVFTILILATPAFAQSADYGQNTVRNVASTWLNLAGWIMIGGAGICFIFSSYQAFQREWSSAAVGILVCILLGFGPSVLTWVADQWRVASSNKTSGALFLN